MGSDVEMQHELWSLILCERFLILLCAGRLLFIAFIDSPLAPVAHFTCSPVNLLVNYCCNPRINQDPTSRGCTLPEHPSSHHALCSAEDGVWFRVSGFLRNLDTC